MLKVKSLDAGYGQVQILRNVDIDISEGEIVAVLGSNGAGKSTLNNNISGLYRPLAVRLNLMERTSRRQAQTISSQS